MPVNSLATTSVLVNAISFMTICPSGTSLPHHNLRKETLIYTYPEGQEKRWNRKELEKQGVLEGNFFSGYSVQTGLKRLLIHSFSWFVVPGSFDSPLVPGFALILIIL
jgi:hypothetical protein